MYWLPASVISIGHIFLLRVERVRSYFGIPPIIRHPPDPQEESKGFMGYFKDSELTNCTNLNFFNLEKYLGNSRLYLLLVCYMTY